MFKSKLLKGAAKILKISCKIKRKYGQNYLDDVFCVSKFLLIDGLFLRVWVSIEYILLFEPRNEKTNVLVSDLV